MWEECLVRSQQGSGEVQPVFLEDRDALFAATAAYAVAGLEDTVLASDSGEAAEQRPAVSAGYAMDLVRFVLLNMHPAVLHDPEASATILPRLRLATILAARHDPEAFPPGPDLEGELDMLRDGLSLPRPPSPQAALAMAHAAVEGDWASLGLSPRTELPSRRRGAHPALRLRTALEVKWPETDGFCPWRSPVRPGTSASPSTHPARLATMIPDSSDSLGIPLRAVAPMVQFLATSTTFAARAAPFSRAEARDMVALCRGVREELQWANEDALAARSAAGSASSAPAAAPAASAAAEGGLLEDGLGLPGPTVTGTGSALSWAEGGHVTSPDAANLAGGWGMGVGAGARDAEPLALSGTEQLRNAWLTGRAQPGAMLELANQHVGIGASGAGGADSDEASGSEAEGINELRLPGGIAGSSSFGGGVSGSEGIGTALTWSAVAEAISDVDVSATAIGTLSVSRTAGVAELLRLGGTARTALLEAASVWQREALKWAGVSGDTPSSHAALDLPKCWELIRCCVWAAPSPGVRVPLMLHVAHRRTGRTVRIVLDVLGHEEELVQWPPDSRPSRAAVLPGCPEPLERLLVSRAVLGPTAAAINDTLEAAVLEGHPRARPVPLPLDKSDRTRQQQQQQQQQPQLAHHTRQPPDDFAADAVVVGWLRESEWNRMRALAEPQSSTETDTIAVEAPGAGSASLGAASLTSHGQGAFQAGIDTAPRALEQARSAGDVALMGWDGSRSVASVPGAGRLHPKATRGRIGPVTPAGRLRMASVLGAVVHTLIKQTGLDVQDPDSDNERA
jgi:hypothetical protein